MEIGAAQLWKTATLWFYKKKYFLNVLAPFFTG